MTMLNANSLKTDQQPTTMIQKQWWYKNKKKMISIIMVHVKQIMVNSGGTMSKIKQGNNNMVHVKKVIPWSKTR